jgi:hypothetical protein
MERPPVSPAETFKVSCTCYGGVSTSGQGTLPEKKFAPARAGQNIPHIPLIPRQGYPAAGVKSGNVGKGGKDLVVTCPAAFLFKQEVPGPKAQTP